MNTAVAAIKNEDAGDELLQAIITCDPDLVVMLATASIKWAAANQTTARAVLDLNSLGSRRDAVLDGADLALRSNLAILAAAVARKASTIKFTVDVAISVDL